MNHFCIAVICMLHSLTITMSIQDRSFNSISDFICFSAIAKDHVQIESESPPFSSAVTSHLSRGLTRGESIAVVKNSIFVSQTKASTIEITLIC